ncbi:unnamed protein product [Ceratitis capitata]|uniref:(Mediterranean fruit fly) hypothetical protein n=1 Tax=Ceratitis capitata TaxID=7213 RepID=A0A811U5Q6_CERCA|nr:unnamed protein product [Ceratitis capitata]
METECFKWEFCKREYYKACTVIICLSHFSFAFRRTVLVCTISRVYCSNSTNTSKGISKLCIPLYCGAPTAAGEK